MSANNDHNRLMMPDELIVLAKFAQTVKQDRESEGHKDEYFDHNKIPGIKSTEMEDFPYLDMETVRNIYRNGSIPSFASEDNTRISAVQDNHDRFPPYLPIDYDKYRTVSNQCHHGTVTVCDSDKELVNFYWSYNRIVALDALEHAKSKSAYLLAPLECGVSYEIMNKFRTATLDSIVGELQQLGLLNDKIREALDTMPAVPIESEVNIIQEGSSCSIGCIPLVFCPCGALNRDCSVYCPNCHKQCITGCEGECCSQSISDHPRCPHSTRYFSSDMTVVYYYPVMNGLLDSFFSGNDEFMHSLTNRERLVNAVFASENDVICQDLSVNAYAVSRRFGDNALCSVVREDLETRKSPLSHTVFLNPDVQLARELTTNGYLRVLSSAEKKSEVDSFNQLCRSSLLIQRRSSDDGDAMDDIPYDTEEERGANHLASVETSDTALPSMTPTVIRDPQPSSDSSSRCLDPKSRKKRGKRLQKLLENENAHDGTSSTPSQRSVTEGKIEPGMTTHSSGWLPEKYSFQKLDFAKIQEYFSGNKELQTDEKEWYTSLGMKPDPDNCNAIRVSLLIWRSLQAYQLKNSYAYLNESCFRDSYIQFLLSSSRDATDPSFDTCQIQSILEEIDQRVASKNSSLEAGSDSSTKTSSDPLPSSDQRGPEPENEKANKIQFNHPGNDVDVIELRVCGTLHADEIPLFESDAEDTSANVITYVVRSSNPVHQSSRAFTLYLGIISGCNAKEDDSVFVRALREIELSTAVLGKYGCYFKKDGQWYHLTWFIQGVVGNYQTLTRIAKHGHSSATFPCLFCPVEKKLYNPFYESLLPSTWSQIFDPKTMEVLDSSLNFINPGSLYRISSVVCKLSEQSKDLLYNQLMANKQQFSHMNAVEFSHLRSLFSFLDQSYLLMWIPPVLASLDSLQRATELTISVIQGVPYKIHRTDPTKLKQDLTDYQLEPQSPPTGDDKRHQAMTFLPKEGIYSVDPVHLFSNTFKRFCVCLNNQLPTFGDKSYYTTFARLFSTFATPSSFTKRPGFVPKMVNALACRRIRELGETGYSWLSPDRVIPSFFDELTCDQRMVLYFCLFTYMYQDSLAIPVVYFMNVIVGIMSEMYIINRNYEHASILQARLSTYLGLLESNVTPNYASSSTHLPDHLYQSILFLGPLFEYAGNRLEQPADADSDERKSREPVGRSGEKSAVTSLASIFSYQGRVHPVPLKDLVKSSLCLSSSQDWDLWAVRSLIDDYVFSMNAYMPHDSYLDHVFSNKEQQWEQRYRYLKDKIPKLGGGKTMYSSLCWNDCYYEAATEKKDKTSSLKWLQHNLKHVAFTRGFDKCLYYVVIRGFYVYNVNGILYPVAICSPIKVKSMNYEYYSYYCLRMAQDWDAGLKSNVMISLYRLTVGTSLLLPFANSTMWGIAPMMTRLHAFNEIEGDKLFIDLRKRMKEMTKWCVSYKKKEKSNNRRHRNPRKRKRLRMAIRRKKKQIDAMDYVWVTKSNNAR